MTPRRARDAYYTPNGEGAIAALVARVKVDGTIVEPCAGTGNLVEPLRRRGYAVITNDVRGGFDATKRRLPASHWVITNPPFSKAYEILLNARRTANVGVAFLLRLSFLEPTHERARFLTLQPPSQLIVLPRMSFTNNKRTDSVTCAWMVWSKQPPLIAVAGELKLKEGVL